MENGIQENSLDKIYKLWNLQNIDGIYTMVEQETKKAINVNTEQN